MGARSSNGDRVYAYLETLGAMAVFLLLYAWSFHQLLQFRRYLYSLWSLSEAVPAWLRLASELVNGVLPLYLILWLPMLLLINYMLVWARRRSAQPRYRALRFS